MKLPAAFIQKIENLYQDKGSAWLQQLALIIQQLAQKWQLSEIKTFDNIAYNYVAFAYSNIYKTKVVLKILIADTHEVAALRFFDGKGCVKLLDYDAHYKGLLLEYLQPGISLKSYFSAQDTDAIEITSAIIQKLHQKKLTTPVAGFKTINQWHQTLATFASKKISATFLNKAQKLSHKLLNSQDINSFYLLHGDLHHENILQNDKEWIAIDPKGVMGPLECEVTRFIMNPIPDLLQQQNVHEIIINRIDKFCTIFGFDKQLLIDWTFVQTMLSACWAEQDNDENFLNYFLDFAQFLCKK